MELPFETNSRGNYASYVWTRPEPQNDWWDGGYNYMDRSIIWVGVFESYTPKLIETLNAKTADEIVFALQRMELLAPCLFVFPLPETIEILGENTGDVDQLVTFGTGKIRYDKQDNIKVPIRIESLKPAYQWMHYRQKRYDRGYILYSADGKYKRTSGWFRLPRRRQPPRSCKYNLYRKKEYIPANFK